MYFFKHALPQEEKAKEEKMARVIIFLYYIDNIYYHTLKDNMIFHFLYKIVFKCFLWNVYPPLSYFLFFVGVLPRFPFFFPVLRLLTLDVLFFLLLLLLVVPEVHSSM